MTTAVFDTLKAARHLEDAGIETKQAEAIVTTMAKAFDDSVARPTKADQTGQRRPQGELATASRCLDSPLPDCSLPLSSCFSQARNQVEIRPERQGR